MESSPISLGSNKPTQRSISNGRPKAKERKFERLDDSDTGIDLHLSLDRKRTKDTLVTSAAPSPTAKSFVQLQYERRKIEQDSTTLKNRVSLLYHENDRTIRKIEQTQKKVEDVYHKRKGIIERREEWLARREEQGNLIKSNESLSAIRLLRDRMSELRNLVAAEKHKDVVRVHAERELVEQELKRQRSEDKEKRRNMARLIRIFKEKSQQEVQKAKVARAVWAKENFRQKKLFEVEKKKAALEQMKSMELQESKLLEKLTHVQTQHRQVVSQLETALATPIHMSASIISSYLPTRKSSGNFPYE